MIINLNDERTDHQAYRFKTNAPYFNIDFHIDEKRKGYYPHVGLSSQEGIMVLFRKSGNWYNLDCFTERFDKLIFMNKHVNENEEYEVLIYGPILNHINRLSIETPDESYAECINDLDNGNILVCGGLVSHGMGCTTPALVFGNILGRKLNVSVDFNTFNDKDFLEKVNNTYPEMSDKKYYIGILEVDYSNQNDQQVQKHLLNVVKHMKSHCNHLICWSSLPPYRFYKKNNINKILEDNEDIILEDYSFIHEKFEDICTYSGNFLNDSANMMISEKLEEKIRSL